MNYCYSQEDWHVNNCYPERLICESLLLSGRLTCESLGRLSCESLLHRKTDMWIMVIHCCSVRLTCETLCIVPLEWHIMWHIMWSDPVLLKFWRHQLRIDPLTCFVIWYCRVSSCWSLFWILSWRFWLPCPVCWSSLLTGCCLDPPSWIPGRDSQLQTIQLLQNWVTS